MREKEHSSFKRWAGAVARACISGLLIWYLLTRIKWRDVASAFSSVNYLALALLILASVALIGVSCLKWQSLLASKGIKASFWLLFSLYVVGYFFNNVLPSSVGGDFIRMYELGRKVNNYPESIASVFMERYIGFAGMLFFAVVAFLLEIKRFLNTPVFYVVGLMLLVLVLIFAILFNSRLLAFFEKRVVARPLKGIKEKLSKVASSIYHYRNDAKVIAYNFFLSLVYNVVAILNVLFSFWLLGERISFYYLFIAVPLVLLISAIPVSLGNIGFNEGAYVYCLSFFGVSPALALAVSLVLRAKSIATGVAGGIIYVFMKR